MRETLGLAERSLGELATALPGATAILRKEKLDYCCGGAKTLREAAAAKSLDLAELTAALETLAVTAPPVAEAADSPVLIDQIVSRYHETHKRELPELIRLATRVEAVHRERPDVPAGLADLLERILGELTEHMHKEEFILFPLMRNGGHPAIGGPIAVMLGEHEDHGAHLRALETLTGDFVAPEGACNTWRALYLGLRKFADDLVDHISTENNILFPRFAA